MSQVLDYSAGFPGAQAIRAAGYAGAVRYIGFPDRKKCTTAGEVADFTANRVGMALVHENTITDWRGGYGAGQSAAQRSRNHADAIGFPDHRPIYLAVDQDVVTSGEFGLMIDYLRGAGSVLGAGLVGVYGEADAIDRARAAGVAGYFWQTAAWSKGRRTEAHLFQNVGTVYVGGVACDVNDVLQDDWGQHLMEDDVSWTDELQDWDKPNTKAAAQVWLIASRKAAGAAADATARIETQLAAMSGTLTANQAALLAAIGDSKTQIDLTDEQVQTFLDGVSDRTKTALRDVLGSLDNPSQ